ncbi:hypothetical protein C2E23DRAFT_874559 [Lenzites betulinus]|nr:hypothetical protein C2E23DRAFT_874559 [Lenzites betulinus]
MSSPAANATAVGTIPFVSLPKFPALDNTFGAILIGTCVGLMFTYRYFRLYPNDVPILKALYAYLAVLMYGPRLLKRRAQSDFLPYQIFGNFPYRAFHPSMVQYTRTNIDAIWDSYYYLTTSYFDPKALLNEVWCVVGVPCCLIELIVSIRLLYVVTGTVLFVCHGFYLRRVYLIGCVYRPLLVLVIMVVIAGLGFSIFATTQAFHQPSFAAEAAFAWLVTAGYSCAFCADVVLTSSLIWVLHHRRTGFKSTDSTINILIVYTVNTGLLTGIISLLSLIFSLVYPDKLIYIGLSIVSAKCYVNSVLAVLNSRHVVAERQFGDYDAGTFGMSALGTGNSRPTAPVQADVLQLARIRSTVANVKVENGKHHMERAESSDTLSVTGGNATTV